MRHIINEQRDEYGWMGYGHPTKRDSSQWCKIPIQGGLTMPFYGKKLGMVQYVYGSWQPVHCVISAKWLGFMYTHIWPFEMALVGESTALTKHDISIMLRHFSNNIALNHSGRKPKTERRVCVYIPSPEMYSSVCIYIYIYYNYIYTYWMCWIQK